MALFGRKTKEDTKTTETSASSAKRDLAHVLRHARITEKATMHAQDGVYVFDVADVATKRDIMAAVKALYSVTPRKVRVASIPVKVKRNMRTGKIGVKTGGKKVYVYLKKGDAINL